MKYNKIVIISIVLALGGMLACSSPRSGAKVNSGKTSFGRSHSRNARNSAPASAAEAKLAVRDTTVITLTPAAADSSAAAPDIPQSVSPAAQMYNSALAQFNAGKYEDAYFMFSDFTESYTLKDSKFYSAKYFISEYLITKNRLDDAVSNFIEILNSRIADDETMQQTLVRLGQVYCLQGKRNLAQRAFSRLLNEYPNSRYTPLAVCD